MFRFDVDTKVQDKLTGFKGIILERCEHLYGHNTYGVVPKKMKIGNTAHREWFEEGRLIKL